MQKQNRRGRSAIYARVSLEEQAENNSIPDQLFECRKYAEQHDLEIVREYIDMESGLIGSRAHMNELIADARAGAFDTVIVKKIDRLGRGLRGFYRPMDQLSDAGVSVKFAIQDYPEEVIPFLVAFAEFEVKMIKERTSSGRRNKARAGIATPPPVTLYGYDFDRSTRQFVIHDEEAEWVRQIFAWHLKGWGRRKIAQELNAMGVPTRRQRQVKEKLSHLDDLAWCKAHRIHDPDRDREKALAFLAHRQGWMEVSIEEMLANSAYCGEGYANKYKRERGAVTLRPREEWIPFPYPPIIDRATYDEAQRATVRLRRYRNLQKTERRYLLGGMLYCSECQKRFIIAFSASSKALKDGSHRKYQGKGTRSYLCRGMRYYPHLYNCRNPKSVNANRIEQAVWERVYAGLRNPELLLAAAAAERVGQVAEQGKINAEMERIEQHLARLDVQTQRILRLYSTGEWNERDLNLQRTVIAEEREALETRLAELQSHQRQNIERQELAERVEQLSRVVRGFPERVKDMTMEQFEQATEILRIVVDRIWVDGRGEVTMELVIGEVAPVCQRAEQSVF